uniref:Uncharacterized protein n=1 Tax=Arundo donax TaxID=35708 RepID=A0A0A9FCG7_ARUDO
MICQAISVIIILMVSQMPLTILAFHHTFVLYHPPRGWN